ncbi:TPA: hypothetical protein ACX6RX_003192 [Photobacterium damselae]
MTTLSDKIKQTTNDLESATAEHFAIIEEQVAEVINKSQLICSKNHNEFTAIQPNNEIIFSAISISSLFIQVVDLAMRDSGHDVSANEMAKIISSAFGIYADANYEFCHCNSSECRNSVDIESILIDLAYGRSKFNS